MNSLAPHLEAFFTDRLMLQRRASPHTIAAYRDTFRLLLVFACQQLGKEPSTLDLQDLDAPLIGSFLESLEKERGNGVRSRNARLAAIHSFFRYLAVRAPEHSAVIQRVQAIPHKRFDRTLVSFLTPPEIQALLAAPDSRSWTGCRDHALLVLAVQTGLRVSELIQLNNQDVHLDASPHVRCSGKGRKERCTPLTSQTTAVLRQWLRVQGGQLGDPLFPSRRRARLSRDAVESLVAKHATRAASTCMSLAKKHISPHTLRHTAAMQLLQAGVDRSVIALWLGHESVETTEIYLHADLKMKERALALTSPLPTVIQRYRATDALLTFLNGL